MIEQAKSQKTQSELIGRLLAALAKVEPAKVIIASALDVPYGADQVPIKATAGEHIVKRSEAEAGKSSDFGRDA